MDRLVYETVKNTPAVQQYVGDRVYGANSVGVGDNPARPEFPWIAINELPSNPFQQVRETGNSTSHVFAIYVYDELGDSVKINEILSDLRASFKQLSGVTSPSGARCTDSRWEGTSGLIPDREYSSNVKFCTIRLVANQ